MLQIYIYFLLSIDVITQKLRLNNSGQHNWPLSCDLSICNVILSNFGPARCEGSRLSVAASPSKTKQ